MGKLQFRPQEGQGLTQADAELLTRKGEATQEQIAYAQELFDKGKIQGYNVRNTKYDTGDEDEKKGLST